MRKGPEPAFLRFFGLSMIVVGPKKLFEAYKLLYINLETLD